MVQIMISPKKYDVFLSHNSKDKPLIERLVARLRGRGAALDVWFDKDNLKYGDSFLEEIPLALRNSKAVIFCIGEHGLGEWHEAEMKLSMDRKRTKEIRFFVVLLPPVENLPNEPIYDFLRDELYCKWDDTPETTGKLLDSILEWLSFWRDREIRKLQEEKRDLKTRLKQIDENIQQIERESIAALDSSSQKAVDWLDSFSKGEKIERYVKKLLENFPELEKQIRGQKAGFRIFCNELEIWLRYIRSAFTQKNYSLMEKIDVNYGILEFESRDEIENREMYCLFLNKVLDSLNSVPSKEIDEQTKTDLASYFEYFEKILRSLI
jgi:hypothetical protein